MPKGDGTGPLGHGPRTGRGCGPCAGWGHGWHHGLGWGFLHHGGQCPFYQKTLTKKEEKDILEDNVKDLEEELKAINARLAEIRS